MSTNPLHWVEAAKSLHELFKDTDPAAKALAAFTIADELMKHIDADYNSYDPVKEFLYESIINNEFDPIKSMKKAKKLAKNIYIEFGSNNIILSDSM